MAKMAKKKEMGGYKIKKKMLNCAPTLYIPPSLCSLVWNSSYFCTERRDIGIQEVRKTTIDPRLCNIGLHRSFAEDYLTVKVVCCFEQRLSGIFRGVGTSLA